MLSSICKVNWFNYNTCMVKVSRKIIARELPSVGRVYNQLRLQSTMLSFLLKLARSLLKLKRV